MNTINTPQNSPSNASVDTPQRSEDSIRAAAQIQKMESLRAEMLKNKDYNDASECLPVPFALLCDFVRGDAAPVFSELFTDLVVNHYDWRRSFQDACSQELPGLRKRAEAF